MIRLLKTALNGATAEIVASSWIEALAGLSRWNSRSVPPDFCASAAPADKASRQATISNAQATRPAQQVLRRAMTPPPFDFIFGQLSGVETGIQFTARV